MLGDDDRAEFSPSRLGIDEKFLGDCSMNEKIEELKGFLGGAEEQQLEDINQSLANYSNLLARRPMMT